MEGALALWSTVGGSSLLIMTFGLSLVFSLVFPIVSGIIRPRKNRYQYEGPILFMCSQCPDCQEKNAEKIASIQKMIQLSQSRVGTVVAVEDTVRTSSLKPSVKEALTYAELTDKDGIYSECAASDKNESTTYEKMKSAV